MQATDLIFPRIGLADSAVTLVFALLGIGFIPALIFAWAFELTPDGIKKEKDVDRSQSVTHNTGRKMDFVIIGVMAVALGYFVLDKFVFQPDSGESATLDVAQDESGSTEEVIQANDKSIAVLPFVNMSSDIEQEYFSDGISEELLNLLAKVPKLRVISRSSSFTFKDKDIDIPTIAKQLNVAHIL